MAWQDQDGVVARRQLIATGCSPSRAVRSVDSRRWQVVGRGVYATFTGSLDGRARVWAALLAAGAGAVASQTTALWLIGVVTAEPDVVQISVPADRRPRPRPGVRLYRRRDLDRMVQPTNPPRTRVDVSVIDAAAVTSSPAAVLSLVFAATQGRFTTALRLREELDRRGRHRWRALLLEVLSDVGDGAQSNLERRYRHDVERAHGLPRGQRNRTERTPRGNRYRDVRYLRWRLVVELDGRQAHPDAERHRDHDRDNRVVVDQQHDVLRYGWHSVAFDPCEVARQVATMLQRNGWQGEPRRCPKCG